MRHRLLALLAVLCLASPAAAASGSHTRDSLETIKENLANAGAVLIDVREVAEWNHGRLQDATNIPLSELQAGRGFDRIAKDKVVYLHCQSGRRVLPAQDILNKAEFTDIRALPWGYPDLVKNGFKVAP